MLESLVANVLNRSLGAYVSNLEVNQLNIAIWTGMSEFDSKLKAIVILLKFLLLNILFWKGDVKLRNLQLKKEALDKFNLPIDILEGVMFDKKIETKLNKKIRNTKNLPNVKNFRIPWGTNVKYPLV